MIAADQHTRYSEKVKTEIERVREEETPSWKMDEVKYIYHMCLQESRSKVVAGIGTVWGKQCYTKGEALESLQEKLESINPKTA